MHQNPSFAGPALRLLAAASLACTLATVGCSTDRTPGSGQPERLGPSVGPVMPSSTSTPGSERGNPINPTMISSYSPAPGAIILRRVNTDALAIAAANQSFRGRYLGPADPGGTAGYVSGNLVTGQFISPSATANPEITVNSSISSPPNEVISSGGVGGGVIISGGTAVTTVPATGALTAGVTTTPTISSGATPSPAAAVLNNNGGFLTPTMSSAATPSPNVAANPGVGNAGTLISNTTSATSTRSSTASSITASGTSKLIIGRAANGTVTVTNIPAVGNHLVMPRP